MQAVALARQDVPQGEFLCLELESLPGSLDTGYDGVLADLVLHYHPWQETVSATRALAGMMVPGGTLMFRVNASDDTEFGAGQGEEVEPGLYLVPSEGIVKRYFAEFDVRRLMGEAGLSIEGLEHAETTKYGGRTKRTWQGSARQG